jgi:NAD(P)H-dependent FMN reductase
MIRDMITILSGTNRPGSNTLKVATHITQLYRDMGVSAHLVDLAHLPQEIFDPSSYAQKPASFVPFGDAILKAKGVVIVTPEYNGGMPGVLKYFIDMLKFPESFEHRPVCFVGLAAGMWGAIRPVEHLQQIFAYRNAHLFPERVFIPGINKELDAEGKFTGTDIPERLKKQAQDFNKFVRTLHP